MSAVTPSGRHQTRLADHTDPAHDGATEHITEHIAEHAHPTARAGELVTPDITGIIVPVPEARPFAPNPHITLLAPFRDRSDLFDDSLRADLRAVFATKSAFRFRLVEVRRFPDDHVYLVPDPDEPFRAMTIELSNRYPDCPPYGGAFSQIIPHLTIDPESRPAPLPIDARATVTQLVHSHGEEWDVLATFPLAGAAIG